MNPAAGPRPIAARAPRGRGRGGLVTPALAVGLAALLLLTGCAKPRQRAPRVAVTVAQVQQRAVPLQVAATGTVEPIQSADVGSQVGGVITRIAFREGQEVAAGQVLIELDQRPFLGTLAQAQGVLARDRAQYASAHLAEERAEKLFAQNLIAASDHDQAVAAAGALRAAVEADSAAVANARLNLEYASIRSPITGRTGSLNVHVGDLVKAATSDPLVTVNQMRPIRVRFTLPQDQILLVQRYQRGDPKVFVHAGEDSVEIAGRLAFVDNAVDLSTGTILLKGEFANRDGLLWPGEMVEVRLVLAMEPNAIVVPAPAVTNGQQGPYVYVLNPDSTASPRPVRIKRSDDVIAVVASGLKPGETVVTDGQFRLAPGARVLVRSATRKPTP